MTQTDQVLLDLIKKSLWDIDLPDYDTLYDEPVDWAAVFEEAKIQAIPALVASSVPDTAPEAIRAEWNQLSYKVIANYHRVLAAQDKLLTLLKDNDIPVAILKGSAAAIYYTVPSKRSMGDIDFLIPQELCDSTEELLKANGYIMTQDRERNPRHSGFVKDGVHFELHHHFCHDDGTEVEKYISAGLLSLETHEIDGHSFTMLPSLSNGVVLLDHMRNHLKSGLGLRQVIDWMMYVNSIVDNEYWNKELQSVAEDTRLRTLATTVTKMCRTYMGLPCDNTWYNDADSDLCSVLINSLITSGNFGRKKGVGNSIEAVTTKMRREGIFATLQRSGMLNWKAYRRHNWLKPFCWFYQLCRYIKKGFLSHRNSKQITSDINASANTQSMLDRLGI